MLRVVNFRISHFIDDLEKTEKKRNDTIRTAGPVYLVVVGTVDVTWHAEVADLNGELVSDEAVACGQVAMDEVLLGEVLGAGGHLPADVDQLPQTEHRRWRWR